MIFERDHHDLNVVCSRCGAKGVFRVSTAAGTRGHGFRVEKEAPGFIERGAAANEAAFRAECRRCHAAATHA